MTYIILLNYNNWPDTLACLQSLFAMPGSDYRVVVCDNASQDGSLERIRECSARRCRCPASRR